jgi:hypothetical protein
MYKTKDHKKRRGENFPTPGRKTISQKDQNLLLRCLQYQYRWKIERKIKLPINFLEKAIHTALFAGELILLRARSSQPDYHL